MQCGHAMNKVVMHLALDFMLFPFSCSGMPEILFLQAVVLIIGGMPA